MSEPRDFERELHELHESLESASYYDFLGLETDADYIVLRDAFYERSQLFHPDRFVASDDAELKQRVYAVYKRMTEAYNVLSDPQLRVAYDELLDHGTSNRLSDGARARRLSADERAVNNILARIYLRSGRAKLQRDDVIGAWIDCRLGLSLEDSPPLVELRDAIRRSPGVATLLGDDA